MMVAHVSLNLMMAVLPLLICLSCAQGLGAETTPARQQLKVQRHLKRINKTPVKTITSPDGDTIDCVHVSHQPAFDHPFLRNHTIQMRPAFYPEGIASTVDSRRSSPSIAQPWHLNGKCPEDTVPIRRTTEADLLRARSVRRYGRKRHRTIPVPLSIDPDLLNDSGHQHAIAYVEGDRYYGAKATINVWKPMIQRSSEFSLSQLWILGGAFGEDLNSIEAGWQVSPDLYGDNNTRLFTYWTSDAYQATGCYNLLCSGFIQINNEIALGASIFPLSNYGGSQYDISILVWKDPQEGHWWIQFGNDYVLGYWPSFLFSFLAERSSMVQWGGEVVNSQLDGQHTSTDMGSGHFPQEGFGKSSYFRNIQIVDASNNLMTPKEVGTFTEQPSCYDVQDGRTDDWGYYFYYGGPVWQLTDGTGIVSRNKCCWNFPSGIGTDWNLKEMRVTSFTKPKSEGHPRTPAAVRMQKRILRALVACGSSPLSHHSSSVATLDRGLMRNRELDLPPLPRATLAAPWAALQSRGAKALGIDVRIGNVVQRKGRIYQVLKAQHTQHGRGGATIQVELRDVDTGNKTTERFRTDEAIERVFVEEKSFTYLYQEGESVMLMEPSTFEQVEVNKELFGKAAAYLKEDMTVTLQYYDNKLMSASVPHRVTCKVVEAQPNTKGLTAVPQYKRVLLENGLTVLAPPFVETGDEIIVNTTDDSYSTRAKE